MIARSVEILDTTLRDGEQTSGVSFTPHEKLSIAATLLRDVKVDRLEVASARVSQTEHDAVSLICRWARQANMLHKVEILGFVDYKISPDWIASCGGEVINLLVKGSLRHCEKQLGKTLNEHISDIKTTVTYAQSIGLDVNIYLEDWSNGIKDTPDYVFNLVDSLMGMGIKRFMLPDTLGVLNPLQVAKYFRIMVGRYPELHFDFHSHNDYDLAVGNSFAAVLCGARGLHVTVNGLGERCGNAPLASIVVTLRDQIGVETNVNEKKLNDISHLVSVYSGIPTPQNSPVVGRNTFTQVAGVHADGDNKANLYCNLLTPERFSREREYALGKASGRASITANLRQLGMVLSPEETQQVAEKIAELGAGKETVTKDDLPYIVNDVLQLPKENDKVRLLSYLVSSAHGLKPVASLNIEVQGEQYSGISTGDGQYDAFVKALRKIYSECLGRTFPLLYDYSVSIPPGGRTDALVQTIITWRDGKRLLRTRAVDADQTKAAIKATIKMLNLTY